MDRVDTLHIGLTGLPHVREKSVKFKFFKVRELSGNFANCQGNLDFLVNVRELSGNFENTRFKSSH